MGVMQCDRKNCDNILCQRCIVDYTYYICNDCWEELLQYKDSWEAPISEREIIARVVGFMATEPGSFLLVDTDACIDEVFDRLTKSWD